MTTIRLITGDRLNTGGVGGAPESAGHLNPLHGTKQLEMCVAYTPFTPLHPSFPRPFKSLGREQLRWTTSPAFDSPSIVGDDPIPVRDFISSALYDPDHGYFSKRAGPVGVLDKKTLEFNNQGVDMDKTWMPKSRVSSEYHQCVNNKQ
ncbi:hypothetical protein J5N97_025654 [Dioscorea zingiberensis]|uniref:Protein arginine methyltransferase NDUFAF7 n=1 Tax=Dioscorea zingiberensis TaxID=325984 RepID=A0A9D5H5U6_9LILI|nr:hypothetical protein J5N97_025654 [Dioscorea zingiberensis]